MPFDGLNQGLTERLSWSGIVPVSNDVLEAHKVAEVAKHPGDWLYRHRHGARIAVACGMPICVVMALIAFFSIQAIWSSAVASTAVSVCVVIGVMLVVLILESRELKTSAVWYESFYEDQSVPEPIWALAEEARRQNPGAYLVIGELIQDRVVLDPYLILCEGNDRVCLGIWDGETIIAMADRREP